MPQTDPRAALKRRVVYLSLALATQLLIVFVLARAGEPAALPFAIGAVGMATILTISVRRYRRLPDAPASPPRKEDGSRPRGGRRRRKHR